MRWRWAADIDPPPQHDLVAVWREAESRFDSYGAPYELACVRAALAEVLTATGDAEGAREAREAATKTAQELRAAPLLRVLGGSIRDHTPLPEVLNDVLEAQQRMRELTHGVGFALMVATMLHSIATGNLLPAWVKVACVDINPATVTKLTDRGSIQTVGIVTDAEPFLRALVSELGCQDA